MDGLKPVAVYGLNVPCGDDPVEAENEGRATFRITMAAIDPTATPKSDDTNDGKPALATLKMIRVPGFLDDEDDEDDSEDEDFDIAQLLNEDSDEDKDSDEDEDEANGDTDSSPAAMKKAAVARIKKAINGEDDSMAVDGPNGDLATILKEKSEEDSSDEDEDEDMDLEDIFDEPDVYVICTLDPKKNYQQPLDITINHDEQVFFQVSGAYDITLTGNYLVPTSYEPDMDDMYDEEDAEYDLSPDEDEELDILDEDEESDELDDLEDPRLVEVDSDEEITPKINKNDSAPKKGKNKREAEADEEDEKSSPQNAINGDAKLSKKQLKKLKKNDGQAIDTTNSDSATLKDKSAKPLSAKSDKKVQFAKNLEQGPTSLPKATAKEEKPKAETNGTQSKASLGVKIVNGVTIDDKKLGTGPAAKKGNKVSMRYIGKLESTKKVFDSNKKGSPFTFNLGKKEVIQGWDIGVEGMSVGGERRITIPAHLAYGKKGAPPDIPPNSTLVFDVKMLEIK